LYSLKGKTLQATGISMEQTHVAKEILPLILRGSIKAKKVVR